MSLGKQTIGSTISAYCAIGMTFSVFKSVSDRPAKSTSSARPDSAFKPNGPICLTIACAVVLSIAVVLASTFFLLNFRKRELAANEKMLSNTALIVSEQIGRIFTTITKVQEDIVQETAKNSSFGEKEFESALSSHAIHVKLRDKASGMPYVESLAILNAQGHLINCSYKWPIPQIDAGDREFVRAFQRDSHLSSFVSEPVRNRATGTLVVHLARKITGQNGEFLGITTAAIDLKYLENAFKRIASEAGDGMGLFRTDGAMLARIPRKESLIGRRFPHATSLRLVATADQGVGLNTGLIDGKSRVVAAHRVNGYPIVVSSTKRVPTIFSNWKHTEIYIILAAIVIIGAIAAFAALFVAMLRSHHALTKARVEKESAEKYRLQGLMLDAALNNMSQGLVMFDGSERLILRNRVFVEMYGLPPEIAVQGRTLREMLALRIKQGSLDGDAENYRQKILDGLSRGESTEFIQTDKFGRWYRVINVPMENGGWVATHEDVTEKFRAEQLNEQQKVQLDAALENMIQGISLFDAERRMIICNRRYSELYKLTAEQTKPGTTLRELLEYRIAAGTEPDEGTNDVFARIKKISKDVPYRMVRKLRDGRYISIVHKPMDGGGWVSTHEDITAQKDSERELGETKIFLDSIIQHAPIAILVKDAKTLKFVLANRALEETLAVSTDWFLGKDVFDIYPREHAEPMDKADRECLANSIGIVHGEYPVDNPRLGRRILNTKRFVIRDAMGEAKYLVLVIDDVTQRRMTEQQIAFMAHHDALTGLANRVSVMEKIDKAVSRQRRLGVPFSVLMLDLDRFKQVNDTIGHAAGDTLLRKVAERLKASLRETDVLARLGGDEFAVIQSGGEDQRASAGLLANRFIELVSKPFEIDGKELAIGVSVGISLAPEHGTDPDDLMKMADMALYDAKSAGRNVYRIFDPVMSAAANKKQGLESDLRRAIRDGDLELHYQPIIDAKTGKITSVEALVRWRHPVKGLIAAQEFIPLAEESGLITQISEWVLCAACAEAVKWPAHVVVAVNLSPLQFRKADLVDIVMCALTESGLSPERLVIEITETTLIESAVECLPALRKFKNLGVAVALDDFGTGYSSLSHLTMFPFNRIKIDKSFTQNIGKRADCTAIITSVLALAQSLDIATTAEGVETVDQYRFLRLAGATSLQGYLFMRPSPASELDFDRVFSCLEQRDAEKRKARIGRRH